MKALVLYETKYGFTEKVAQRIAEGLIEVGFEVICRRQSECDDDDLRKRDLWVLGTPNHYGRVPLQFSALVKGALKEGHTDLRTVVFETRMKDFPDGASIRLKKLLERKGIPVIAHGSFVVASIRGPLLEGEESRAKDFGIDIGRMMSSVK
jgi:flavodoxin